MIAGLMQKGRQLANDTVLRLWLWRRITGQAPKPPLFTRHVPPYASTLLPLAAETPQQQNHEVTAACRPEPTCLNLAGTGVDVVPGTERRLMASEFDDLETRLALHRFQWLPLMEAEARPDGALVAALWRAWASAYAEPSDDWPWHPYTAAERAVNVLGYARRAGMWPAEGAASILARHAPAIAAKLEFFGSHDTSNHLAANGRGLYTLGLELGLPRAAALGFRILTEEARSLFMPSGMLREGSSHYHLLVLRNYLDSWLLARRCGRGRDAETLQDIALKASRPLHALAMPGRLPLIGDVSPDCPPSFLVGLVDQAQRETGWFALLDRAERIAIGDLLGHAPGIAEISRELTADGWLRAGTGDWALLSHAAPGGMPPMPGHSHQDCGAFELHWRKTALVIDAGRGRYGESGVAARARGATVHSGLTVSGADPFPANKPYYDAAFRRSVAGPPPVIACEAESARLTHHGFSRLGDVAEATRTWHWRGNAVRIEDTVEGRSERQIVRRLLTPWPAMSQNGCVIIAAGSERFAISADAPIRIEPSVHWPAYATEAPATMLIAETHASLPFNGWIEIKAL